MARPDYGADTPVAEAADDEKEGMQQSTAEVGHDDEDKE